MASSLAKRPPAMTLVRMCLASAALVLAAMSWNASPALSYGPNDWMQFGGSQSSHINDRTFVRRWEANPPAGFPTLSPANVEATKLAIERYKKIVSSGGWEEIPDVKLRPGDNGPSVAKLRRRLFLSGDIDSSESWAPESYDYYLETGVKRYQASNGLAPTGVVDERTRAALNVSSKTRLKQLEKGIGRLREFTRKTSRGRYVAVNIPSAHVEAVENDRVVSRHAGVVGKIERKTPLLTSRIHELNFNPVWRLPPTVISKDLIPKGRRMHKTGNSVLVRYGIDAYDGSGRKVDPKKINWNSGQPHSLSYRQQPGKDNPMGFLKINFHNAHAVYMHDTPSDNIFGRNFRAASSGCIRVQNIEQLATWILNGQDGWDSYRIDAIKQSGETKNVSVKNPVKLYFTYITAWATEDGVIQFRRDIYGRDGLGSTVSAY